MKIGTTDIIWMKAEVVTVVRYEKKPRAIRAPMQMMLLLIRSSFLPYLKSKIPDATEIRVFPNPNITLSMLTMLVFVVTEEKIFVEKKTTALIPLAY